MEYVVAFVLGAVAALGVARYAKSLADDSLLRRVMNRIIGA